MSNLILTKNCSKGCSYCFAKQFRSSAVESEMSLELLDSILAKHRASNIDHVSLLGGEPTQHSQFLDILAHCIDQQFKVTIISNLLFSDTILQGILSVLDSQEISFLVNATELDKNRQNADLFEKNYTAIYNKMAAKGKFNIACGLTLDGNLLTQAGFDMYLNLLEVKLPGIPALRLSLNFPGNPNEKEELQNTYLKNLEMGDLLYYAARRTLFMGAEPHFDCITFPCMYRSTKEYEFVNKYAHNQSRCTGEPADYLPDGTVRYCFPSLKISVNSKDYSTDSGIHASLRKKYDKAIQTNDINKRSNICSTCDQYHKTCDGPCLGFCTTL